MIIFLEKKSCIIQDVEKRISLHDLYFFFIKIHAYYKYRCDENPLKLNIHKRFAPVAVA